MKGKVGKPVVLQARKGHPASTTANPSTVVYPPSSTHKPASRSASFAKGPQLPAGGYRSGVKSKEIRLIGGILPRSPQVRVGVVIVHIPAPRHASPAGARLTPS